jgi:chromosome partitioning protein
VKVLALYSIKGGVGKTTAAVNLSAEAARCGARVLLWDLDPQGAATFAFRIQQGFKGGAGRLVTKRGELARHVRETDVPGVHLVPADFSLRNLDLELDGAKHSTDRLRRLLAAQEDRYDVAILDCPPGISLSSEAVFVAAD